MKLTLVLQNDELICREKLVCVEWIRNSDLDHLSFFDNVFIANRHDTVLFRSHHLTLLCQWVLDQIVECVIGIITKLILIHVVIIRQTIIFTIYELLGAHELAALWVCLEQVVLVFVSDAHLIHLMVTEDRFNVNFCPLCILFLLFGFTLHKKSWDLEGVRMDVSIFLSLCLLRFMVLDGIYTRGDPRTSLFFSFSRLLSFFCTR